MWAWLTKIAGKLPIIGDLLSASEKAEETRAQVELEEARAFAKGRYSPKYVFGYALVFMVVGFFLVCVVDWFFPDMVDVPDFGSVLKALEPALDALKEWL